MCGFVIKILKYEKKKKKGKKTERKKENNFGHCKIHKTKLMFLSLI